jgi:hypothetical protein
MRSVVLMGAGGFPRSPLLAMSYLGSFIGLARVPHGIDCTAPFLRSQRWLMS